MIEYLPWSEKEQATCLNAYQLGIFSILDIELGGGCNYYCVYCDSPDRKKGCNISLAALEHLMLQGKFRWVFICGLGEPSFSGDNYNHLLAILDLCEKYGLRCSIFTNLSNLTEEIKDYIRRGILFLLFKFDTLKPAVAKKLYGTDEPEEQLNAIEELKSLVRVEDGMTNIGASIVPTQRNIDEIPEIVKYCKSANIFPLLGELESSGRGEENYSSLFVSSAQLANLKQKVEQIIECEYSIPLCAALVNGIHIANNNSITVDAESGLSCHWFWLKEPKTKKLGVLNNDSSLKAITADILQYRRNTIPNIKRYLSTNSTVGGAFGGCGGDITKLFKKYLSVAEQPNLNMSQVHELVNNAYNHIADKYAEAYSENDETDFHYFNYFVENMQGRTVLDMGCGVGANTDLLNKNGIWAVGIDASSEMLKNARRMYPSILFGEQNILSTSFPDKTFDGIVLSYVIEHFNNAGLQQLHVEIDRILKDNGLLFITSHEGNGEALLADPLDEKISIYYNFLSCDMIDNLFSNYEKVDFAKRASYGPDEFLNDKIFVTYRKK